MTKDASHFYPVRPEGSRTRNNEGPSNPRYRELSGKTFGRWYVLKFAGDRKWLCECTCSKKTRQTLVAHDLTSGASKSCGCLQKESPGAAASNRQTSFSQEQHECMEGLLLSDAGLWRRSSVHTESVHFYFGSVFLAFAQYIRALLPLVMRLSTRPEHNKNVAANTKSSRCQAFHTVTSLVDRGLLEYDRRWYVLGPDGKRFKRVPEDLVLTPRVALFWFLGDGSTSWIKRPSRSKLVKLQLHTNSFLDQDVARLIAQLRLADPAMQFNLGRSAQRGPLIVSSRSDTVRGFFRYIDLPPKELHGCPGLLGKWKIPTAEKLVHYGDRPGDSELLQLVESLVQKGWSDKAIAREFTARGFPTARNRPAWSDSAVKLIRRRLRCDQVARQ